MGTTKSSEWPLPPKDSQVEQEGRENGDSSSQSPTAHLDVAEVTRVLPLPTLQPGNSHRMRRTGTPSVVHSLISNQISEPDEGEDPTSVLYLFWADSCVSCELKQTNKWRDISPEEQPSLAALIKVTSRLAPQSWSTTCIAVRLPDDDYSFFPYNVTPSLAGAIARLDETAAVAMSSRFTATVINSIVPGQKSLIVDSTSARIPIVSCLDDVTIGLVHFSRACIVMEERLDLVWSHNASAILNVAFDVERQLGREVSFVAYIPASWLCG